MKTRISALHTSRIEATIAAVIIAASIFTPSCRRSDHWRITEGSVWRTTYRIVYDSPINLDDSVIIELNRIEQSLSPFNPESLISRINDNRTDFTDSLIDSVFAVSSHVSAQTKRPLRPNGITPLKHRGVRHRRFSAPAR